jgi:orotate phosphoribosyltransferase
MNELLSTFKERGALLEGHFLLSSGLHSPRYLQCARVLMDPELASRLGRKLAKSLQPLLAGAKPSAVVAPALGGVIVAHEVARALGCRGMFTERQDGVMTLRRGFGLEPGEEIVVVEDVITTGGSTREVMDAVRARGARVLAVGSLVDRSEQADLGVPRCSLLKLDVPAYPAGSCPLCQAGSKPEKPGSRARPAGEAGSPRRRAQDTTCRCSASTSPTTEPTSRVGRSRAATAPPSARSRA